MILSVDLNFCLFIMVDGIGGWGVFDVVGCILLMSCIFLVSLILFVCLKS